MTHTPPTASQAIVVPADQIDRWKNDVRQIEEQIERLQGERTNRIRMIDAAEFLRSAMPHAETAADPDTAPTPTKVEETKQPQETQATQPRKRNQTGWKEVVLEAVAPAELGLTYAELRAAVAQSILGDKLDKSDKGYHNAISRLAKAEEIIRDHGRVFTPEAFKRFMDAVEAGEASTTVPQPIAYSPMGEAILDIVVAQPGQLNGKGIIRELRKNPEFNASLTPHETGAYNIIARLVRRGQIARRDDGAILPGRNFPRDRLRSSLNENEAPNGDAAGASEAGEAATSPIENRPVLKLIG